MFTGGCGLLASFHVVTVSYTSLAEGGGVEGEVRVQVVVLIEEDD